MEAGHKRKKALQEGCRQGKRDGDTGHKRKRHGRRDAGKA